MQPALSVIFFTVLSGFGYGLFIALALASASSYVDAGLGIVCSIVGLALVTGGLISSTLHLANPKNAWRAFSRFRTSWLSREGALALVFYPPALLYLAGWWFGFNAGIWWVLLSVLVMALAFATVFATGMIYGCLKTIRQWHTPLTPIIYILLAVMSGRVLLLFLQQWYTTGGYVLPSSTIYHVAFIVICFAFKLLYYHLFLDPPRYLTPRAATGLPSSNVRLLDVGHTAGTFLTDEFGYRVEPYLLMLLRVTSMVLAFVMPVILLTGVLFSFPGRNATTAALLSMAVGLFVERWLFFADARHVVNLYHGAKRA